ncbi:MAG: hypothetical protein K9I85_13970 [Saprospiraceae bacterium]|nr:hypothetical protein [Saprospiraceae bacterium]
MKFVSETIIDQVIESLDRSDEALEKSDQEMADSQPALLDFLTQEAFDLLTEEEQDYMLLLGLTLWESARKVNGSIPELTAQDLGNAEEANYNALEGSTGKNFRERMDVFFNDYPQEDLLAFIEDALVDEDEELVTSEGRETLFVTLKTVVDVLDTSC